MSHREHIIIDLHVITLEDRPRDLMNLTFNNDQEDLQRSRDSDSNYGKGLRREPPDESHEWVDTSRRVTSFVPDL